MIPKNFNDSIVVAPGKVNLCSTATYLLPNRIAVVIEPSIPFLDD